MKPPVSRHACEARVYDRLLGGKDNYLPDRTLAGELLELQPHLETAARENRAFLARAVAVLGGLGVRQFLDIGCGLPTGDNVHQIAARHAPGARTVYVDHDPIVITHARAIMADDSDVTAFQADLRKPAELLGLAAATLDWDRPVAVLLGAVVHHLPGADDPAGVVAELRAALPPGGALVLTHATADVLPTRTAAAAARYGKGCGTVLTPRTRRQITAYFDGLTLLPPGVVLTAQWRARSANPARSLMYGGVGLHS
ncbi:SAM-dependent methyltransferase [Actinomadura macrotermitis]|uniref:SAM-dependent methyltransferase n=1 Tax=Actinomadura macrotermitis TaxID=2585200 RepID=A0A7K0BVK8_9ACTN|nr:SAM-dependent methyltransferase [Actinomadura macrotermitis]MQY05106.1 hypothetical protein [Actinomadura macrotermitis]